MNEQAEKLITEAGQELLEWMQGADGFVLEQAPLLAQEIVRWGMVRYGLLGLACVAVISSGLFCVYWASRSSRDRDEFTDAEVFLASMGVVMAVPGLFGVMVYGIKFAKVFVAPRLYILEQIGGMIG